MTNEPAPTRIRYASALEIDHRVRDLLEYLAGLVNGGLLDDIDKAPVTQLLASTAAAFEQMREEREAASDRRKAEFWDALLDTDLDFRSAPDDVGPAPELRRLFSRYHAGKPPWRSEDEVDDD
jgi:hypothetical protein